MISTKRLAFVDALLPLDGCRDTQFTDGIISSLKIVSAKDGQRTYLYVYFYNEDTMEKVACRSSDNV